MRDRNSRINRLKACKERLDHQKAEAEKQQQDKIDERKSKKKARVKSLAAVSPSRPKTLEMQMPKPM